MSVSRKSEFEGESSKLSIIKIVTDEPTLDDALDFDNYSQNLANIITNSTPRFAIGIFGGWGTGKTSLMRMTKKILDDNEKVVTVWFDAWRYEREENLAVIPFLRTIKLTLDASHKSREGGWEVVKNGVKRSAAAFLSSTKVTYGIKDIASAETDFGKIADTLKGNGSVGGDTGTIYFHVTEYLEKALNDLRKENAGYRIVVFIDDLDRCSPDRALEVLESVKSFFDMEGIVYVIGMDSETINSLVKKKYGAESHVKGLDYLQKIVQLPFQIPTWKGKDIAKSMSKIISKGLEGSSIVDQFEENKYLIVEAVQPNPREVKRFINNVILAKAVFNRPTVGELIAVRALEFRKDWSIFLELISPDDTRTRFLTEYKRLKEAGKTISNEEELDKLIKERSETEPLSKDIVQIYRELLRQGFTLRRFLDVGAADILLHIEELEGLRRALNTAELEPIEQLPSKDELLELLRDGKVEQFNRIVSKPEFSLYLDFAGADLSDAKLSDAKLSNTKLSCTDLSHANLRRAKLLNADMSSADLRGAFLSHADLKGAFLSHADLRGAFLNGVNLSHADLSNADLSSSVIIGCKEYANAVISEKTNFDNALVDEKGLLRYLIDKKAKCVPSPIQNKNELEERLMERGFSEEEIMRLLRHSSLPTLVDNQ